MDYQKWILWIICIAIGIIIGIYLAQGLLVLWLQINLKAVFIIGSIVIGSSFFCYYVSYKFLFQRLRKDSHLFILSGLITLLLTFMVGDHFITNSRQPHTLVILPLAESNPQSQGNEVRVLGLKREQTDSIPLFKFEQGGNWKIDNDALMTVGDKPSWLVWKGKVKSELTLEFQEHEFGGRVLVVWDGYPFPVDLYHPTNQMINVTLDAAWRSGISIDQPPFSLFLLLSRFFLVIYCIWVAVAFFMIQVYKVVHSPEEIISYNRSQVVFFMLLGVIIWLGLSVEYWDYWFSSIPAFSTYSLIPGILLGLLILYFGKWVSPIYKSHTRKAQVLWLIISILVGVLFIVVIPVLPANRIIKEDWYILVVKSNFPWLWSGVESVINIIKYVGNISAYAILLFFSSLLLSNSPRLDPGLTVSSRTNSLPSKWSWLLFAIPMVLVYGVYLLAFWPGFMSPDSVSQWTEVIQGRFSDAHPAVHTWTLWLISRLWLDPAMVSIVQILSLSILAAYALSRLRKYRTPRPLITVTALLFALSIVNGTMVISIWKDILFAVVLLWLFILLFEIIQSEGEVLKSPIFLIQLILACFLFASYRHNGLPAFILTFLLLIIFRKNDRRKLFLVSLASVFLFLFVKGPVYRWAKVKNSTSYFEVSYELFHIAAHLEAGTPLSQHEAMVLNQIRPIDDDWEYDCLSIGNIISGGKIDFKQAYESQSEIRSIFLSTLSRFPLVNINHVFCSSKLVWQITSHKANLNTVNININNDGELVTISKNSIGLVRNTKFENAFNYLIDLIFASVRSGLFWLIWRPAIYLYLFLYGVVVATIRTGRKAHLQLAFPIIGVALSLILVNGSQDFRYMYPVYVISMLYWPYLLFSQNPQPSK